MTMPLLERPSYFKSRWMAGQQEHSITACGCLNADFSPRSYLMTVHCHIQFTMDLKNPKWSESLACKQSFLMPQTMNLEDQAIMSHSSVHQNDTTASFWTL